jgi:hypothetical protein
VNAAAGWYADPSGVPGQLRWWDGSRWTDHVTPDPSAVPAATTPGGADAHAADGHGGSADPTQPPPPTGTPDTAPTWGDGSGASWGSGDGTRPPWQVDTPVPSSGSSVRTWLIVGAVIGVILIVLVGLLLIGALRAGSVSFSDFDDEMFVEEWDEEAWDGETVDGGQLSLGESVRGEVPSSGTYEVTVDIQEAGTYVIDVRGEGGFDGMLEVEGPDGGVLAENDDREDAEAGGDSLDPYLELDLEPGEHRVIVRGWAGDGGAFSLTVDRA